MIDPKIKSHILNGIPRMKRDVVNTTMIAEIGSTKTNTTRAVKIRTNKSSIYYYFKFFITT